MLLNQCLAISLSPSVVVGINGGDGDDTDDDLSKQSASQETSSSGNASYLAKGANSNQVLELKQSSAQLLFQQLLDKNYASSSGCCYSNSDSRTRARFQTTDHQQKQEQQLQLYESIHLSSQLKDALSRVEFAGFVMPSWLLLSGSFNDLHCIKSSWFEGQLKAPSGFKIETIGNIRSVNVDYLGYSQQQAELEQEQQQSRAAASSKRQQQVNYSNHDDERPPLPSQFDDDYDDDDETKTQTTTNQSANERLQEREGNYFASQLDVAILDSIIELTSGSSSSGGGGKAPALASLGTGGGSDDGDGSGTSADGYCGVRVHSIIERLATKLEDQQQQLASVESVDCAIEALVRGGRLSLKQLAADERKHNHNQPHHHNHPFPASQPRSLFADWLISCAPEPAQVSRHHHHHHHKAPPQPASSSSLLLLSASASPNSTSTIANSRSKSNTLDSGIRSWDLASSSENSNSAHSPVCQSNGFGFGHESATGNTFDSNYRQQESDQPELTRRRPKKLELLEAQSGGGGGGGSESRRPARFADRARAFSLGRSFSFRPKKQAQQQSNERPARAAMEQPASNNHLHNHHPDNNRNPLNDGSSGGQTSTSDARPAPKLTNLFRSKSLRIISTGGKRASRATATKRIAQNFDSDGPARGTQKRREEEEAEEEEETHKDLRERNSNWPTLARPTSNSNNTNQATIDYLATAQPHKQRAFSIRRNSLLAFNSSASGALSHNDLASSSFSSSSSSSGGKIVLFLRRLFSVKRINQRSNNQRLPTVTGSNEMANRERHNLGFRHEWTPEPSELAAAAAATNYHHQRGDQENNSNNNSGCGNQVRRRLATVSSPSSGSSSGSNSLIEILDCSRVVNQSKRSLREQHLVRELNRASWRMIKRSDSSQSELSSCSTTASEQLRRHLDEAYKRHRNCTSQREKEFIDSINVLRQASRHALSQAPRSTSKTRHASKSVASGHQSRSDHEAGLSLAGSQSGAVSTTSGSCSNCDCAAQQRVTAAAAAAASTNHRHQVVVVHEPQQQLGNLAAGSYSTQHSSHHQSASGRRAAPAATSQDLRLANEREDYHLSYADDPEEQQQQQQQQQQLAKPLLSAHSDSSCQVSGCCICASYLSSVARLCPLAAATAYCPASAAAMVAAPLPAAAGAACCPALVPAGGPPKPADMCMCPLWRSMVSNYSSGCQSANSPLIFNPTAGQTHLHQHQLTPAGAAMMAPATNHQTLINAAEQQQQPQLSGATSQQSLSTTTTTAAGSHQHQHHNTTIDLKIEIGAELSKRAAAISLAGAGASAGSGRRSFSSRKQQAQKVVEVVDSLDSDQTTSSLSSSSTTTDESLPSPPTTTTTATTRHPTTLIGQGIRSERAGRGGGGGHRSSTNKQHQKQQVAHEQQANMNRYEEHDSCESSSSNCDDSLSRLDSLRADQVAPLDDF